MNKFLGLFIVLVLSFFAIKPLFITGFFPMHDDTQVARVFEMAKSLRAGMFPVRWVPDLGYGFGYPLFNFYGPLAYYVGGAFVLFGFNALLATKIMMAIGIILAGVSMWFLSREFFGEYGGIVAGILYIFAPYHALDIYVRGDVTEFYAYALIPLVFLGMNKIHKENSKLKMQNSKIQVKSKKFVWFWICFTAFSYAVLIVSHNLSAMMVTPFIIIAALVSKQKATLRYSLYAILFGLGLAAFYWLPAILELGKTNVLGQIGGGADYKDHFVCLSQLWDSPWGFGGSTRGCIDGLSFRIGKIHILISLSVVFLTTIIQFVKQKRQDFNNIYYTSKNLMLILLLFLCLIISIVLTLQISQPVWDFIKPMAFFQYPWRFLLLVSFFTSFLGGAVPWLMALLFSRTKYFNTVLFLSSFLILISLFYTSIKLFQPQTILAKTVTDYTSDYALKWVVSKTSDEYLPKKFSKPGSYQQVFHGEQPIMYTQTPIEKLANAVSLASMLLLVLGIIMGTKRVENQ